MKYKKHVEDKMLKMQRYNCDLTSEPKNIYGKLRKQLHKTEYNIKI